MLEILLTATLFATAPQPPAPVMFRRVSVLHRLAPGAQGGKHGNNNNNNNNGNNGNHGHRPAPGPVPIALLGLGLIGLGGVAFGAQRRRKSKS